MTIRGDGYHAWSADPRRGLSWARETFDIDDSQAETSHR